MPKLKDPFELETAFESYRIEELIGEGGAGRVYGGINGEGKAVAVKVLQPDRASTDKKRRFKNETAYLAKNTHKNIVTVRDQGLAKEGKVTGPFCVMDRYDGSLRALMVRKLDPEEALKIFGQILDGVEAAHFHGIVHRDLKPENVLVKEGVVAIADFGIASFTDELLLTAVETQDGQRLANFVYAAPEQRVPGGHVDKTADIYALGLMLNEMITGSVPHGTNYANISSVAADLGFLDGIVEEMIRQAPKDRLQSIEAVKTAIEMQRQQAVTHQELSKIDNTVIPKGEIQEPLAHEPPRISHINWNYGTLELHLDREVTHDWIAAFHNLGNYTSLYGKGPPAFQFVGNVARVAAREGEVQAIVDHFNRWLPDVTKELKAVLEGRVRQDENERQARLDIERRQMEARRNILKNVKF